MKLKIAEDCRLGVHGMRLRTATGVSEYQRFMVEPFPVIDELEQSRNDRNDTRLTAQLVEANHTVQGQMHEPADIDCYKLDVKQGQRISAEIVAVRLGVEQGIPDLHLALLDANGKQLIAADDTALFVQDPIASVLAPADGTYFVEVRHATFSARGDVYRLHLGTYARPTGVYPAGGPAGKELAVQILGDPKGHWSQKVTLPSLAATGNGEFSPAAESTNFPFVAVDVRRRAESQRLPANDPRHGATLSSMRKRKMRLICSSAV